MLRISTRWKISKASFTRDNAGKFMFRDPEYVRNLVEFPSHDRVVRLLGQESFDARDMGLHGWCP